MLAMLAMPCTTVQKMISAISTRMGLDERVTQRLHLGAKIGIEVAERDSDGHRDEHLKPEL
jgi:hypothetical protein